MPGSILLKGHGEQKRNRSRAISRSSPEAREIGGSYSTPRDFEQALSAHLKRRSGEEGVDLTRLRKRVAFDRFLARVFREHSGPWRLKGGYALEVRLGGNARATRDIDLSTTLESEGELIRRLGEAAGSDAGDYFKFRIRRKKSRGKGQPGSIRFSVEASIGGKTFEEFSLDAGLNESELLRSERRAVTSDLSFAGIPKSSLTLYSLGEHIAEKFHAYTRPYENPSRVKDLVDMMLILESFDNVPEPETLHPVLRSIFDRNDTHDLPARQDIRLPPAGWEKPFESMAEELGLKTRDFIEAHQKICDYLYASKD